MDRDQEVIDSGLNRLLDDIAATDQKVPPFEERAPELVRHRGMYGIAIRRLSDDGTSVLHAFFGQDGTLTLTRADRWGRKDGHLSLLGTPPPVSLTEGELGWLYSNQTLWAKTVMVSRDWAELLDAARKAVVVLHGDISVPEVIE